ncbi:hypothetical protein DID80_01270 [Candidatus Marinamargulisbacteria bacterium SCGC AAA071-K20]|nr:hypothetical protein DID80_01270 [Candidatus Marinamargulisbacteria bacterium SCGC AAA071-K20]
MKKNTSVFTLTLLALQIASGLIASDLNKNAIDNITLKGDVRLRYQSESKQNSGDRTRNRIRFRLGGEGKLSKEASVKFGLATGGTDPRSTNQTIQDSFQTADIRLDYAYLENKLSNGLTLLGGKMKNPLYRPSDLLWDTDINPGGVAVKFKSKKESLKWFASAGYFVLDENKTNPNDPGILTVQPGLDFKLNQSTNAKVALGFFLSQNVGGLALDHSSGTNTGASTGIEKEFSTVALSGQVVFKNKFGLALIRPFGEIVVNTNQSENNKGAIAGLAFGDTKVKKPGTWQSKLSYRYLQTDAWLDIFPDSDAYGGATNSKGLEFTFKYGLSKATSLGLDIYSMDVNNGATNKQDLIQIDINRKF